MSLTNPTYTTLIHEISGKFGHRFPGIRPSNFAEKSYPVPSSSIRHTNLKLAPSEFMTDNRLLVRNHRARSCALRTRFRVRTLAAPRRMRQEGSGRGVTRKVIQRGVEVALKILKRALRGQDLRAPARRNDRHLPILTRAEG